MSFRINVATVGDIDSGKTTLTDRIIYLNRTDKRRAPGSIQRGTTLTDTGKVEAARGITIHSVPIMGGYVYAGDQDRGDEYSLTIVDTPGHPDFELQVRASIDGVEGALFLYDLTKGVTAHSTRLLSLLMDKGLRVVPVLNKVDLVTESDYERRVDELREHLLFRWDHDLELLSQPEYDGDGNCDTLLINNARMVRYEGLQKTGSLNSRLCFYGSPTENQMHGFSVSGETGLGVTELLTYVLSKFPPPETNSSSQHVADEREFSGKVLNYSYGRGARGRRAVVRVHSGSLERRARIENPQTSEVYRVSDITDVNGKPILKADGGDIVLIGGLDNTDLSIGHTLRGLGTKTLFPTDEIQKPVIGTEITADERDLLRLIDTLNMISRYDKSYSFDPSPNGFTVYSHGSFHLEVLVDILRQEHGIDIKVKPFRPRYVASLSDDLSEYIEVEGRVISKTIIDFRVVLGYERYTNPSLKGTQLLESLEQEKSRYFRTARWFGHFPLDGSIAVIEAQSSTGQHNKYLRNQALRQALDKLLYESGAVVLQEPYVRINAEFRDRDEADHASKHFLLFDYKTHFWYGIDEDHFMDENPLRKLSIDMPVRFYIENEGRIKAQLSRASYHIRHIGDAKVPYDEALGIIEGIVGVEPQRQTLQAQGRQKHQYGRSVQLPEQFPDQVTIGNAIADPMRTTYIYRGVKVNQPGKSAWAGGRPL